MRASHVDKPVAISNIKKGDAIKIYLNVIYFQKIVNNKINKLINLYNVTY